MLRPKKIEIRKKVKVVKEPIKTKTESHKIESNPSKGRAKYEGENPSFKDQFILDSSIHIRIFKQIERGGV
jgi:hypothetical protein